MFYRVYNFFFPWTHFISRKFSLKSDLKSPPDSTVSFSSKNIYTLVEIKFLISNHSFPHFSGRWKCRWHVIWLLNIARNKIYLIPIELPFFQSTFYFLFLLACMDWRKFPSLRISLYLNVKNYNCLWRLLIKNLQWFILQWHLHIQWCQRLEQQSRINSSWH